MSERIAVHGDEPRPLMPYSPAIKAGGWLFVSGQLASDFETGVAPQAGGDGRNPYVENQQALQSRFIMQNLKKTVEAAGCDFSTDVVRIYQWWTSDHPTMAAFEAGDQSPRMSITPYLRVRDEYLKEPRPASTGMGIRRLLVPGCMLEVNLIAMEPGPGVGPAVGVEVPDGIPSALAGYSAALRRGDWVFLAGDTATDWTGDYGRSERYGPDSSMALDARVNPYLWYDSAIEQQTDYTLQKLAATAEAAGSTLDRAVKATVYLGHPKFYEGMDTVWRQWFPENPPARTVIPLMGLGPSGALVEIAFKLLTNESELEIETIEAEGVPPGLGHEPQAVRAGRFVFFSTQLPFDDRGALAPSTQRRPGFPFYGQPPKLQMRYMLDNVQRICEAAGTSLDQICSRQAFHHDFAYFAQTIEEWAAHFPNDPPASSTMEIGGPLLVPGAFVLLDLIGYVPDGTERS